MRGFDARLARLEQVKHAPDMARVFAEMHRWEEAHTEYLAAVVAALEAGDELPAWQGGECPMPPGNWDDHSVDPVEVLRQDVRRAMETTSEPEHWSLMTRLIRGYAARHGLTADAEDHEQLFNGVVAILVGRPG